jgi:hypothetical protein
MNSPATSLGSGGCRGPTRQTELKRFARKSQLISAASRTSGWRRLIIASRDARKKSSGWLKAFLRQRIRRQKNHKRPKSGIQKCKKTKTKPRLPGFPAKI